MKKIKYSLLFMVLIILVIPISIILYYKTVEIETKKPEKIELECEITVQEFMQRKVFKISPKSQNKSNTKILYFHGGSYMAEASQKHWEFLEQIVKDTGIEIIMPDYPLSPKYTYKEVFQMIEPLYKEIIDMVDINDLILMGDSAGGGLALALEEKIGEQNLRMPEKTILISPWLDVRLTNLMIDEVQKNDKQLNKEALKLAGIAYAGKDGINSYLVNPIDGDISKLKNIIILTGTYDILNPDVKILQERAKKENINIEVKEFEQAPHIWMIEKNTKQELIDKGYQEILSFLERKENN